MARTERRRARAGGYRGEGEVTDQTVLIVEDDPDSRYVYELYLTHKGFRVRQAGSGEEGLALAREARPDVILMDISIPGLDGWEVTRRLQDDPETRDIPVIAITAHAFPEDRDRSRRVGCRGFLTKPCDPKEVLNEILRVLGE